MHRRTQLRCHLTILKSSVIGFYLCQRGKYLIKNNPNVLIMPNCQNFNIMFMLKDRWDGIGNY